MTPEQLATGYFALCIFAVMILSLAVDRYLIGNKRRRPRYIVQLPKCTINQENRDRLRKELAADTERDYVFADVQGQHCVQILEIR